MGAHPLLDALPACNNLDMQSLRVCMIHFVSIAAT
jgi:hypothetical protein